MTVVGCRAFLSDKPDRRKEIQKDTKFTKLEGMRRDDR